MERFTAEELRTIIHLATNAYHEDLRRVHGHSDKLSEYGKRALRISGKAWAILQDTKKRNSK